MLALAVAVAILEAVAVDGLKPELVAEAGPLIMALPKQTLPVEDLLEMEP
jgi:hypothetical protein